ncbi:MAG TPA: ABC transporter ATP-binding protein, partial [Candidatus Bathyarchaeia archaeon]|nr:ABC transporter ATP-binding protein [Candidatus Bathyarchaeia archaeon]
GPSGCGKTTFLLIVAGFIKPTKGTVLFEFKESASTNPNIGFVFQEDAIFPWLTVRENLEFGLVAKGADPKERDAVVSQLIKLTGLNGFEEALPRELSAGMSKMVEVARALATDPPILLLDEPFGFLDAQTRSKMQNELRRIWEKRKKTVILVTHDVDEAIYLADRVIVFSSRPGRVKAEIVVNLPRPRISKLMLSTDFLEVKGKIWKELGLR